MSREQQRGRVSISLFTTEHFEATPYIDHTSLQPNKMNVIVLALILFDLALASSDTVASSSATRLGHSQHAATEVSAPAEFTPMRSLKKEEKKKKRTKGNANGRVSSNIDSAVEDDNEADIPLLPVIPYSPRFVIPESMDFGDDWNHGSTGRLRYFDIARSLSSQP